MRGERSCQNARADFWVGSSPHARGTLRRMDQPDWCERFIPACAGNATPAAFNAALSTVHPRMRGERGHGDGARHGVGGSSPHARGTRPRDRRGRRLRRFIPACAGNALPVSCCPTTIIRLSKNLPIGTPVLRGPIDPAAATVRLTSTRSEEQPPHQTTPVAGHPNPPAPAGSCRRSRTESPRR